MYVWYNEVLRNIHTPREKVRASLTHVVKWKEIATEDGKVDGHIPFATTIHVLNSAIIKLSRAQRAERVFRGTKGGRLPDKFWTPNRDNIRGGIEMAFMSTTMNRSVAMNFAGGESETSGQHQPSVVFEMQMGMIDRGAAVQCFSQFPGEAEVDQDAVSPGCMYSYSFVSIDPLCPANRTRSRWAPSCRREEHRCRDPAEHKPSRSDHRAG